MTFRQYIELMKLRIGVVIALTAVIGYLAVASDVNAVHMVLLALSMLLGSSSSSVFNHFYDRDIDRRMMRTSKRPLANDLGGRGWGVLFFAASLLVVGLVLAMGVFNGIVALHLFLGAFFYGIVYTVWLKRKSWVNIIIGGAAGSFAVLAGAAAVDPSIWLLPTLLAVVLFLWTPTHFWSLAILLKEDYAKAGIPMLPVLVGEKRTAQAILINSVLLALSAMVPWAMGELGPLYGALAALGGAGLLAGNLALIKDPGRIWARRNFFISMIYLMLLFLAVVLDKHL
ncbi:MAG: protoheme IX farnesyltransferase [Alphaproteobacteria bacterium]|nr:protoheme IX farnesyltransferase [Alphaproteobacteria bacterium]